MFEYGEGDQPQIGTEILDPSMPSDLNFDSTSKKKQLEGEEISKDYKYIKGKSNISAGDEIRTYTLKGKAKEEQEPKYKEASIVHDHVDTFEVKALDEEKSRGWKSIWESVVGYVKREVCVEEGYIYIFENTKQGYMTHGAYQLANLFKIFVDPEDSKVRLVFRVPGEELLKNKNFQVKSTQDFVDKLCEEASRVGLAIVSD